MRAVKRIEIVIEEIELENVTDELHRIGVAGYTVVPRAWGYGTHGMRQDNNLGMGNVYLVIACDEKQSQQVIEAIRTILRRYGGICLVSDAQWVIHEG